MDDYYVYIHYNKNGDLVYIGKGKGSRISSLTGRNEEWIKQNTEGGLIKRFFRTCLNEDEALFIESILICEFYKKKFLTNSKTEPTKPIWVIKYSDKYNIKELICDLRCRIERTKFRIRGPIKNPIISDYRH
jgi:hypothetical protein